MIDVCGCCYARAIARDPIAAAQSGGRGRVNARGEWEWESERY